MAMFYSLHSFTQRNFTGLGFFFGPKICAI